MLLFLFYIGRFLVLTWSKQLQRSLLILSTMVLLRITVSAVFSTCHKVDKMIIDKLQYLERKLHFPSCWNWNLEMFVLQEIGKIMEYLKKNALSKKRTNIILWHQNQTESHGSWESSPLITAPTLLPVNCSLRIIDDIVQSVYNADGRLQIADSRPAD